MTIHKWLVFLPLITQALSSPAHATYSIVACDPRTKQCGVAVQTNNLAVGASVPYAQAGVGAVASQFETNPKYGPLGLALMAEGKSADQTLTQLLREDGHFDGQGIEARQVGIVAVDGSSAFYTGEEAASENWAGGRKGIGYSIQGNGLVGHEVVDSMEKAFLSTPGPLADRLMAALLAGDAAGGQRTGRESAALLVRTQQGFPMDIDLRVDHSDNPVSELKNLYDMQCARQQLVEASIVVRNGHFEKGRDLMIAAVSRASGWPRIWIQAAKLAEQIGEPQLALQYITLAFGRNPAWLQEELGSGDYAELGSATLFHGWVTAELEQHALAAAQELEKQSSPQPSDYVRVARMLLEVGRPRDALTLLTAPKSENMNTARLRFVRAEAYAAAGNYTGALNECREAATLASQDVSIRRRCAQLQQEADRVNRQ